MNGLGEIAAHLSTASEPDDQVTLLSAYLTSLEPEDRESAARILAEPMHPRRVRLSALRNLVRDSISEELFALSQDFVGDSAETIALLWPTRPGSNRPPTPTDIVQGLRELGPTKLLPALRAWLDASDAEGRHLLVRLLTGAFKPPASPHVIAHAFANAGVRYQPPGPAPQRRKNAQSDLFGENSSAEAGTITAALLYVHRAASRSAPLLCTFGVWHGGALLPVGKAAAGEHTAIISRHAASHAIKRFGPTTEVEHSDKAALLLTVCFDGVEVSRRHKAGVTLHSARVTGICTSSALDNINGLEDLTKRLPLAKPRG